MDRAFISYDFAQRSIYRSVAKVVLRFECGTGSSNLKIHLMTILYELLLEES